MRQLTLILLFTLLAACGQKGLLYIPDKSSADSPNASEKSDSTRNDNDNDNDNDN